MKTAIAPFVEINKIINIEINFFIILKFYSFTLPAVKPLTKYFSK